MNRNHLLIIILATGVFVHCSKDKKDQPEPQPAPNIVKGLLAFFPFNDNFSDSTNNLTLIDHSQVGVNTSLDRHSNLSSKNFDGGYMSIQPKNWTGSPISVTMWIIAFDSTSNKYFLSANSSKIGFIQDGSKIGFVISNPQTGSAMAETGAIKKWVHVAGTFDGKTIRTYINGKLAAEKGHAGDPGPLTVITMAYKSGVYSHVVIDDLRFYNRVITEAELAQLSKF